MSNKTMGKEKMKQPPHVKGSSDLEEAPVSAAAVQGRLKAERVQLRLKEMPGWGLVHGGRALDRVRELRCVEDAVDFAALALRMASRAKYPAQVHLNGKQVVLTLQGHAQMGARGGITDHLLDFATSLGCGFRRSRPPIPRRKRPPCRSVAASRAHGGSKWPP